MKGSTLKKDLDTLVTGINALPVNRDLTDVETEVWDRINARAAGSEARGLSDNPSANQRTADLVLGRSIGVAFVVSFLVGVISVPWAPEANEFAVFSVDAHYGPARLLR